MKHFDMAEFYALPLQMQSDLLPVNFVDDPEAWMNRYGDKEYFRIINLVVAYETCIIPLTNGDRLHYENEKYIYSPQFSIDN